MSTVHLSRREITGLVAGALGMQFLPMRSGWAQAAKPPLRLLTIIDSYGLDTRLRPTTWIGSEMGDYPLQASDLGTTLQPLSAYTENMLVPTGMDMVSQRATKGHSGHDGLVQNVLCGSSASSASRPGPNVQQAHESIDVRIGNFLNTEYGLAAPRVFPHLFMTESLASNRTTYCYDPDGRQIRALAGREATLSTLFGNAPALQGPTVAERISTEARLEVLASVGARVRNLRPQLLNANASTVMDAYNSSLDELVAGVQLRASSTCQAPAAGDGRNAEFVFDAIYHAFACDLASSITFAFGSEIVNGNRHGFLQEEDDDGAVKENLDSGLHGVSHSTDEAANKTHERVRIYQASLLAKLLDRLKETTDVDGQSSILDNTVVFYPSYYASNVHKTTNLPNVLIAGKNTNLKGGMHYEVGNATNNQLLVTLAQGLGLPVTEFGGYEGKNKRVASLNAGGPISKMLRTSL